MKKIIATSLFMGLFCSCTDIMTTGGLYTNVTVPRDVTSASGNKVGKSSCVTFLWLFSGGDASVLAAKRNGNITSVSSVDFQRQIILFGLISRTTTVITGN